MISVCMATYNGEKYIKPQLESILKQIGKNDEIVISDDGSKDNTKQVVESLGDSRIKWFDHQNNHGFTHNFENAISHASGDIVFLSDQDDIWKDDKVSISMKYLSKCDFVISDCVTVDDDMNILQESRFKAFNIKKGFLQHLIKSRYLGCCMAFKRNVVEAALPFPKNDKLVEHDIWLAAVGLLYFKVALINKPLIYYRRHDGNVSDGGFEKGYSIGNKLVRRLYRLLELLKVRKNVKKR